MPALTKSQREGGHVLCDVCGGILYAEDGPRHSTHTKEEIALAKQARGEDLNKTEQRALERAERDSEAESAEQAG